MKKANLIIALLSILSFTAFSQKAPTTAGQCRSELKKADVYVWPWVRSEIYWPTTDIKQLWIGWSSDSVYKSVVPNLFPDTLSREDIIHKIEMLADEIRPYNQDAASVMTCLIANVMLKKEMSFANYCEMMTEQILQSLINEIEDLRKRTEILKQLSKDPHK